MAQTQRYISASGSATYANSTSSSTPSSLATYTANAQPGDVGNMLGPATYTQAASITPTNLGTVTSPIVLRGCSSFSSLGDLGPNGAAAGRGSNRSGALVTTNMPVLAFNAGFSWLGATKNYWIIEGLNITGSGNVPIVSTLVNSLLRSCYIGNSGTGGAAAVCVNLSTAAKAFDCDVDNTCTTALGAINITNINAAAVANHVKCTNGPAIAGTTGQSIVNNILHDSAYGIDIAAGPSIVGNSIVGMTNDAIRTAASQTIPLLVYQNIAERCAKFLNVVSGNNPVFDLFNSAFNITSADGGTGDWTSIGRIAASASHFVNEAGGDYTLTTLSAARKAGYPGYADIGALQMLEARAQRFRQVGT